MKEKIRFFIKNYPSYVMKFPVSVGVAWFAVIQLIQFLGVWIDSSSSYYESAFSRALYYFSNYSGEDFELLQKGHFSAFYLGVFCVVAVFMQRELFKKRLVK